MTLQKSGPSIQGPRVGKGELWALGAALSYALTNVFTGVAVQGRELDYMLGAGLRALPTLLLAWAMGFGPWRRSSQCTSPLADWKLLAALVGNGILVFVVGNPLLLAALHEGGILIASPLSGTHVLWGAIFAALFLREPFNRQMAVGMAISVGGVLLLTLGRGGVATLAPRWWLALPYATGTAISWSLASVLIAYAMRRGVDRFQALTVALATGAVMIHAYLLLTGQIGLYLTTPGGLLLRVLIAGLFNSAALISLTSALALTHVAKANTLSSLQVGLAPLIAWMFVGEPINALMAVGILLLVAGVVVVQWAGSSGRETLAPGEFKGG